MNIFIAFAQEDRDVRDKLLGQLNLVKEKQGWNIWSAHEIKAGERWDETIKQRLMDSEVVILLLSTDFFNSKYIIGTELPEIIKKHERGACQIIPVLARVCHWKDTAFGEYAQLGEIQALPEGEKPILSRGWDHADEPYFHIVSGIKDAVKAHNSKKKPEMPTAPKPSPPQPAIRLQPAPELPKRKSGLDMVFVEGGTFMMGSPESEKDRRPDECHHAVTVKSFNIGKYPVTQADWKAVMGTNRAYFKDCDDCPVECVSWGDIQEFFKKLNAQTGKRYRLPTEAEWEYAARGGLKSEHTIYAGGNDLDKVGWYRNNSNGKTHPVGLKLPNELGLFDMSSNVWEWCQDAYKPYPGCGEGKEEHGTAVLRGGSWIDLNTGCRSANRYRNRLIYRSNLVGFRCSRDGE